MKVTKYCAIDRKEHTMEIPKLTPVLLEFIQNARAAGQSIQTVVPMLSPDEREFLMTGITPELWEKIFGKSD